MKYRIERIDWVDSEGPDGWVMWSELKHILRGKLRVRSVGYVIREDKRSVTITHAVTPHSVHAPLRIPKVAILKRVRL